MKKVLIVVNIPKFFLSHWLEVAKQALASGYEVHVATAAGAEVAQIQAAGLKHHAIKLNRSGTNPLHELACLFSIFRVFLAVRPDLVHLITIKPVIYGGLVARFVRTRAVLSAVTGLGYVFINQRQGLFSLKKLISGLYQFVFNHRNIRVLFENDSDREAFCQADITRRGNTVVMHGAGVDLQHFAFTPEPPGPVRVVFAARLLRDKGVREFLAAAQMLADLPETEFILAGDTDPDNPASLTETELSAIKAQGIVQVVGFCHDVATLFQHSHIVVLPSYREGLPKTLIEAAACGRAVITSDVPGCRHVIEPDVSGLLVPVKDSAALADAIRQLVLDGARRQAFGLAGRKLAEQRFEQQLICGHYMQLYKQLLDGGAL